MYRLLLTVFCFSIMFILSWNVNGLRDLRKMQEVFTTVKNCHSSLCFLQETFWDNQFIERYKHLWDGDIIFNNCPHENRKGVALLVSKHFPFKISYPSFDKNGRIMKVVFEVDSITYQCVNIYAPNDYQQRIMFLDSLDQYITHENVIVTGDFNEIIDRFEDRGSNMKTFNNRSNLKLKEFIEKHNLSDVWRHRNPGKIQYTRQQFVNNTLRQSRIDLILVSRNLLQNVQNSFIKSQITQCQ